MCDFVEVDLMFNVLVFLFKMGIIIFMYLLGYCKNWDSICESVIRLVKFYRKGDILLLLLNNK